MSHPRIALLQLLNMLMGGGCYLIATTSVGVWSQAGWSAVATGLGMMAANCAYAVFVGIGGRLADSRGRARTAIAGSLISIAGALLAWLGGGPWAAAVGTVLCFGGSALFFPGNVGLFSDAKQGDGGHVPLHVKVGRYNLGWSAGNLAGFGIAWLLSHGQVRLGYLVAGVGFLIIPAALARWCSLPASPPTADGDRADHPALPALIRMGRIGLLLFCLLGMAVISLLENTLLGLLTPATAHTTATAALSVYALGYFTTFIVLSSWGGWVMRPWRLFAIGLILPLAAIGFLACGLAGITALWALTGCAFALGVAFAAIYTASIYYSLRLPHGAAHAAAMHETHLGIGATAGPMLCGAFLMPWGNGMVGLGAYLLLGALIVLGWQLSQLPRISRLLASPVSPAP